MSKRRPRRPPRPGHEDPFVRHVRDELVGMIAGSSFTLSLVPGGEEPGEAFDVKFAVELGVSIMLDKPVVLLSFPGRTIPPGLRRVADAVIELEADPMVDEEAKADAGRRIAEAMAELKARGRIPEGEDD